MEFIYHIVIVITLCFFSILFLIAENTIQSKNHITVCITIMPLLSVLSETVA